MRQILPNVLWIGNAFDARSIKSVLDAGISVVIDLTIEEAPIQFPREVTYCRFPLLDGEGNAPERVATSRSAPQADQVVQQQKSPGPEQTRAL